MTIKKSKIKGLLTSADLQAIGDLMGGLMDKQAAVLASKKDLEEVRLDLKGEISSVEARLNKRMDEGFEAVMQGMDNLAVGLAEKERVDRLVEWAKEVGEKVGVRPRV